MTELLKILVPKKSYFLKKLKMRLSILKLIQMNFIQYSKKVKLWVGLKIIILINANSIQLSQTNIFLKSIIVKTLQK